MHKEAQKLEWKTQGKISLNYTDGYSVVRISRLNDAFSEIPELEAGLEEGQQLQQKDRKRRKSLKM